MSVKWRKRKAYTPPPRCDRTLDLERWLDEHPPEPETDRKQADDDRRCSND